MRNIITDLIDIINNGPDDEYTDYTRSNVIIILKTELKRIGNEYLAIKDTIEKFEKENPSI